MPTFSRRERLRNSVRPTIADAVAPLNQAELEEVLDFPRDTQIDPFGLGLWLVARCLFGPSRKGEVSKMFLDFCEWRHQVGIPLATRGAFVHDLRQAGYAVEKNLVRGIELFEDTKVNPTAAAG